VITDWPNTVEDLFESIDDPSDISKIAVMYRKKWDKKEEKLINKDKGNIK